MTDTSTSTTPALWSFTGVELIPTTDELTLLLDRTTGKRLLVRREVGISLTYCEAFRTLRGHAEHLVATLPQLGGQVEPVVPVLQQICDAGMFRAANELMAPLIEETTHDPLPPVHVFIITCDRPEAVTRLLASMASAASPTLPERYTVIDDSRNPDHAASNEAAIEAHNAAAPFKVEYFGPQQRQGLIDHLITALPEHEGSIRFLLDRERWGDQPTYGIARTLSLLLGIGKRAVVFDDDVLCQAIRCPLPGGHVQFGSLAGRQIVFYGSAEEMTGKATTLRDSPVTLMSRQLGLPLAAGLKSLLHSELPESALAGANGTFVRSLSNQSRIVQTQCSTWGDPGTGNAHWIVDLDPDSIDRLLDRPEGIASVLDARSVWLGYNAPTLTKHGVMSQVSGYDATQLLPPYLPAFRGEDALFSFMLTAIHPNSLVLNHDWAIPHQPIDARQRQTLKDPIPAQGGLGLITRWIGDQIDVFEKMSPEARLSRFATSMRSLADHNDDELMSFGRIGLAQWHAAQVDAYRRQLLHANKHQSQNWERYLERGMSEAQTALTNEPSLDELIGMPVTDTAHTLNILRGGLRGFADALEAWPALWQAMKEMSD